MNVSLWISFIFSSEQLARCKRFLPWGIIGTGIAIRLCQLLENRSLWLDGALLALNIVKKTSSELWDRNLMVYNQAAPLLFLQVEKLSFTLLGPTETALRLFPFVCSCVSLILLYKILDDIIDSRLWLSVGLGIGTFSYWLVYFAQEVKHYAIDEMVALCIILVLIRFRAGPPWTITQLAIFSITGVFAPWFSHPSVFMLAAMGAALCIACFKKGNRKDVLDLMLVFVLWGITLALLYRISLSDIAQNNDLQRFWAFAFIPYPTGFEQISTDLKLFTEFLTYAGFTSTWAILIGCLFFIGIIELFKKNWTIGLMFFLPFCFTILASMIHQYPFHGRLLLFLIPILYITIVYGAEKLTQGRSYYVSLVVAGFILYPFIKDFDRISKPIQREEIRSLISFVDRNRKPQDKVYLLQWAVPLVRYYKHVNKFDDNGYYYGSLFPRRW